MIRIRATTCFILFALAIFSPVIARAACYHVDSGRQIHNTCDYPIKVIIERMYMVSQGMHSIEKSEIDSRTLKPHETWRPSGSGFKVIRDENASTKAIAVPAGR